jgi:hypothetical protein
MRLTTLALALGLTLAAAYPLQGCPAGAHEAAEMEITHVLKATWDTPDKPLTVTPVVVESDAAIAGWTQDGRGGRAVLRRKNGEWVVVLCAGAMLKEKGSLLKLGLSEDVADRLHRALTTAEAALPAETIAQLDSFEGVLVIGEDGHGHGHGGQGHGHGHGGHGHAAPPATTH